MFYNFYKKGLTKSLPEESLNSGNSQDSSNAETEALLSENTENILRSESEALKNAFIDEMLSKGRSHTKDIMKDFNLEATLNAEILKHSQELITLNNQILQEYDQYMQNSKMPNVDKSKNNAQKQEILHKIVNLNNTYKNFDKKVLNAAKENVFSFYMEHSLEQDKMFKHDPKKELPILEKAFKVADTKVPGYSKEVKSLVKKEITDKSINNLDKAHRDLSFGYNMVQKSKEFLIKCKNTVVKCFTKFLQKVQTFFASVIKTGKKVTQCVSKNTVKIVNNIGSGIKSGVQKVIPNKQKKTYGRSIS